MNDMNNKQTNQAAQQILDLGQVSATTLGHVGYLNEGRRGQRPIRRAELADLGKATELTLGRGNLGQERRGHMFTYPR